MFSPSSNPLKGMTFIDLFAGIGGFRLALESLGATCMYSSEWDVQAQRTYAANFHETPSGDITKTNENDIPNHDILCAGFPCQAFSISGKQKGFEDTRGTLFFDVARIIKAKNPKAVFMENVKNIITHDKGRTINVIQETITELGYSFHCKVLNATDYGIPQARERAYFVCFRKDINETPFEYPACSPLSKHVEDILETDSNDNGNKALQSLIIKRDDITWTRQPIETGYSSSPIRIGQVGKGRQGERIYSIKGSAITLSANGGGVFAKTGGYLVGENVRRLSPRECARLQGFPDSFLLNENQNQAYKQLGNSVVVDVLQKIAIEMSKAIAR